MPYAPTATNLEPSQITLKIPKFDADICAVQVTPSGEVIISPLISPPLDPTTVKCEPDQLTLYKLADVPEVCSAQVSPSTEAS